MTWCFRFVDLGFYSLVQTPAYCTKLPMTDDTPLEQRGKPDQKCPQPHPAPEPARIMSTGQPARARTPLKASRSRERHGDRSRSQPVCRAGTAAPRTSRPARYRTPNNATPRRYWPTAPRAHMAGPCDQLPCARPVRVVAMPRTPQGNCGPCDARGGGNGGLSPTGSSDPPHISPKGPGGGVPPSVLPPERSRAATNEETQASPGTDGSGQRQHVDKRRHRPPPERAHPAHPSSSRPKPLAGSAGPARSEPASPMTRRPRSSSGGSRSA